MTISQNSEYAIEHPYTKKAVRDFIAGDITALKRIFDILQIDTYQEVAVLCTKAYKTNKKENFPVIEEAIRDVAPPSRLNLRLPIPPPQEVCIVVPMEVVKKPRPTITKCIVNQLALIFPEKTIKKAPKIALEA